MPIYSFGCPACSKKFDYRHSFKDEILNKCPFCESVGLDRLVTLPSVCLVKSSLGVLAEENSVKNKTKIEDNEGKAEEAEEKFAKDYENKTGVKLKRKKKKKDIPWFRSGKFGTTKSDKPLDLSKISNVQNYIKTGSVS